MRTLYQRHGISFVVRETAIVQPYIFQTWGASICYLNLYIDINELENQGRFNILESEDTNREDFVSFL